RVPELRWLHRRHDGVHRRTARQVGPSSQRCLYACPCRSGGRAKTGLAPRPASVDRLSRCQLRLLCWRRGLYRPPRNRDLFLRAHPRPRAGARNDAAGVSRRTARIVRSARYGVLQSMLTVAPLPTGAPSWLTSTRSLTLSFSPATTISNSCETTRPASIFRSGLA